MSGRGRSHVGKSLNAADMLGRARGGSRPIAVPRSDASKEGATRALDDSSPSRLVDAPAEPLRYEKAAVFLTPEQRQWLKATSKALPVDGLSMSDLVRLAIEQLRAAVDDGLPLVDALTSQAHSEAKRLTGRRNRGLPPVA